MSETDEPITDVNDTPINRAAINQLSVDKLDMMLAAIRERRLERVRKLESIAKVKADEATLVTYLKFERAYRRAFRAIERLTEQESKVDALLHKARLLAVECGA
jgi:hypothetical protein